MAWGEKDALLGLLVTLYLLEDQISKGMTSEGEPTKICGRGANKLIH